jgi:hypothetical protein
MNKRGRPADKGVNRGRVLLRGDNSDLGRSLFLVTWKDGEEGLVVNILEQVLVLNTVWDIE